MTSSTAASRLLFALLAFSLTNHAVIAQQAPSESSEYAPKVGQPGKDVVWVPTPDPLVEQMLQMANVGPRDYVIDLGSGDGRTVIMAAERFRARAMGIEYNPDLVALSKRNAELAGVADRVEFVEADIFESDFSQATVITLYLLPSLNLELRPKILDLRPGTRVVSHSFDMEEWQPDQKITLDGHNAYLWIVPADVAGNWKLTFPAEGGEETWSLALDQEFQMLSGEVHLPDESFGIMDARIQGTEVQFYFIDGRGNRRSVFGRASDGRMEGILRNQDGTSMTWSAVPEMASRVSSNLPRIQHDLEPPGPTCTRCLARAFTR